jgi:diadenosine tetraphosphate (Ap4A) HIT family hydrolase
LTGNSEKAGFELHPRLAADTAPIRSLRLCRILLMNDRRFPWVILVPERAGAREIHDLNAADQSALMGEIARAGAVLQDLFKAHKINVGAIGNIVPQLHVHVVARQEDDAAWPAPVWGFGTPEPYPADALQETIRRIGAAFD